MPLRLRAMIGRSRRPDAAQPSVGRIYSKGTTGRACPPTEGATIKEVSNGYLSQLEWQDHRRAVLHALSQAGVTRRDAAGYTLLTAATAQRGERCEAWTRYDVRYITLPPMKRVSCSNT